MISRTNRDGAKGIVRPVNFDCLTIHRGNPTRKEVIEGHQNAGASGVHLQRDVLWGFLDDPDFIPQPRRSTHNGDISTFCSTVRP